MFNLPLGLIIESIVAFLLLVTILYCIILNSKLNKLRSNEDAMRETIGELLTATEIAERALNDLQKNAHEADKALNSKTKSAEALSAALTEQLLKAEDILQNLAALSQSSDELGITENASIKSTLSSPKPVDAKHIHLKASSRTQHNTNDSAEAFRARMEAIEKAAHEMTVRVHKRGAA
jgi:regulatory protein YycI of two-component signal transduction system YycFG